MKGSRRVPLELNFDSFLDIIANLVGILIILVVVLGAQSKDVAEKAAADSVRNSAEVRRFEDAVNQAAAARTAVDRIRLELEHFDAEIQSRQHERNVMLEMLDAAREHWEAKKSELSEAQKQSAQTAAKLAEAEQKLRELAGQRSLLENAESEVEILEHLPSPMAKTVFGEEIHLRLEAGRVSVVPIDALVESIRESFRRGTDGLRPGSSESTVGPLRGYVATYQVERTRATVNRGGGVSTALRMELVGMRVEPIATNPGEPVDEVLKDPRSILDIELAGRDPATTTVTVWVYPDSFAEFRKLKEHLYARGIATAARPLPAGTPISGGPRGSRSAAQ